MRKFIRSSYNKNIKATTAVEMALIAPIFFLFLIGITEICFMLGAQQLLEHTAFGVSRLAKTGYATQGLTQSQTIDAIMKKELQSYGTFIDVNQVTLTATAYSNFAAISSGQGSAGYGNAQQVVVYTITYPWKLFTPMMSAIIGKNGFINLNSQFVVRNEPYG